MPSIFTNTDVVNNPALQDSLMTISRVLIEYDKELRLGYNSKDKSYTIEGSYKHTADKIESLFSKAFSRPFPFEMIKDDPLGNKRIFVQRMKEQISKGGGSSI